MRDHRRGCCRELLEGEEGDDLGVAGFYVPPMYREGLARAMERMCASRKLREAMGQVGRERVKTYYRHERMLDEYRALYLDTADHYGWSTDMAGIGFELKKLFHRKGLVAWCAPTVMPV